MSALLVIDTRLVWPDVPCHAPVASVSSGTIDILVYTDSSIDMVPDEW